MQIKSNIKYRIIIFSIQKRRNQFKKMNLCLRLKVGTSDSGTKEEYR